MTKADFNIFNIITTSTKYLLASLSFFFSLNAVGQVNFTSSNLPIMIIETDQGQSIPDEPKRTADMHLINRLDGEKNLVSDPANEYDGKIGIEIRGSTSASIFPKVGYGFETRLDDGSNNNVELLGMPEENDWVLHGPYSDKTLMRNALSYIFASQIMDYAPRVHHIELVINGEYQGVYLLTEKIKRDKNRVDISKLNPEDTEGDQLTGGYIIKIDKYTGNSDGWISGFNYIGDNRGHEYLYHYPKFDDLQSEQRDYIQNFMFNFELTMHGDNYNDPISGYPKWIDEESFIASFFINEITKNIDAYRLSTFLYKTRDSLDTRLKSGPVWDFNLGFGNANYCGGDTPFGWVYDFNDICSNDAWKVPFFWEKLFGDPAFRTLIKERWLALRANEFTNENMLAKVDSIQNLLQESQQRNFIQWPVIGEWVWPNAQIANSYNQEVDFLKSWLEMRLAWMDDEIALFDKDLSTSVANYTAFPNPAGDYLNISIPSGVKAPFDIHIYDAGGRLMIERRFTDVSRQISLDDIDVSNLSPGIYFYSVFIDSEVLDSGSWIKI